MWKLFFSMNCAFPALFIFISISSDLQWFSMSRNSPRSSFSLSPPPLPSYYFGQEILLGKRMVSTQKPGEKYLL
jgi:hypothetical protein